jgi:putative membrane protein
MIFVARFLFSVLGLLVIAEIFSGITVDSVYIAFIAAFILGILNAIVRPVLLVLTLPITVITLGLFAFVINALLFMFAASFLDGFDVENFWWALVGSVIMTVIGTIGSKWIK